MFTENDNILNIDTNGILEYKTDKTAGITNKSTRRSRNLKFQLFIVISMKPKAKIVLVTKNKISLSINDGLNNDPKTVDRYRINLNSFDLVTAKDINTTINDNITLNLANTKSTNITLSSLIISNIVTTPQSLVFQ